MPRDANTEPRQWDSPACASVMRPFGQIEPATIEIEEELFTTIFRGQPEPHPLSRFRERDHTGVCQVFGQLQQTICLFLCEL